jgi:hypothetical protein
MKTDEKLLMTKDIGKVSTLPLRVTSLLKKGVRMTNPFSVEISEDVKLSRIDPSLSIYGAARICGENTLIAENVRLGYEAPVTLINCQLGRAVDLKGGYFSDSVFLDNVSVGSNAQVRQGCLLEEESGGNHTVGLKQTILFPFVTLGSLINFCDCLMAGGTNRKNHSEVGSSYIHFNFTPRQDKATASLIGDVPRGVMLKERPIFLGGQGGMVGPMHLDYGTVVPAGVICRKGADRLPNSSCSFSRRGRYDYEDVRQKVYLNVLYIANLLALKQWYLHVRREFFLKQKFGAGLYAGAFKVLENAIAERLKQMILSTEKMESSVPGREKSPANDIGRIKNDILLNWPQMAAYLSAVDGDALGCRERQAFLKILHRRLLRNNSYLEVINSLTPTEAKSGTAWLHRVVDAVVDNCLAKTKTMHPDKKRSSSECSIC